MINVLRDRARRRRGGSGYFPAEDWRLRRSRSFRKLARQGGSEEITAGIDYCFQPYELASRFATALPALIGARTIALLRAAGSRGGKIKVPRKEVRRILVASGLQPHVTAALRALYPAPARAVTRASRLSRASPRLKSRGRAAGPHRRQVLPYSREHETLANFSRLGCFVRRVRAFRRSRARRRWSGAG